MTDGWQNVLLVDVAMESTFVIIGSILIYYYNSIHLVTALSNNALLIMNSIE